MSQIMLPHTAIEPSDCIFVLDFLSDNDLQTGRRIYESIEDITKYEERFKDYNKLDERLPYFKIKSKEDFIKIKTYILSRSKIGFRPTLIIQTHGNRNKGIQITNSNNFIQWQELVDFFYDITHYNKGYLTVFIQCCYSWNAIIEDIIDKKSLPIPLPFSHFYGYDKEVSASKIEEDNTIITNAILRDGGEELMQRISEKRLKMRFYSEEKYICQIIEEFINLQTHKQKQREKIILNSPKELASFIRKSINNKYFGSPVDALCEVIKKLTHPTERRERILKRIMELDIETLFKQLKCPR